MGRRRCARYGDDPQHLRALPEKNLILVHYMLNTWWLHLLEVLGRYAIRPGAIEQVLVMTNNIITFGYHYAKLRIKKTPDIIYKLTPIGRIIS